MLRSFRQFSIIATTISVCLIVFLLRSIQNFCPSFSSSNVYSTVTSHGCPLNRERRTFAALLRHWDKLARLHNISYVIGLGSLLGQYRTGDIIPWDEDVDVLVDVGQFKRLKTFAQERSFKQGWDREFRMVVQPDFEIAKEEDRRRINCTGKEVSFQMDSCSFVSPMARVIYGFSSLDVFPYIVLPNKGRVHDVEVQTDYNLTHFLPFQQCLFMDVKTWCPRNIRGILESAYDDLSPDHKCENGQWVSQSYFQDDFEFVK